MRTMNDPIPPERVKQGHDSTEVSNGAGLPAETWWRTAGGSRLLARGRWARLPGERTPQWHVEPPLPIVDRASHSGGAAPDSHRLP